MSCWFSIQIIIAVNIFVFGSTTFLPPCAKGTSTAGTQWRKHHNFFHQMFFLLLFLLNLIYIRHSLFEWINVFRGYLIDIFLLFFSINLITLIKQQYLLFTANFRHKLDWSNSFGTGFNILWISNKVGH